MAVVRKVVVQQHGWLAAAMLLSAMFLSVVAGCGGPSPAPKPAAEPPRGPARLKLIVFDDPALADQIERQWKARAEGELEVERRAYDVTETTKLEADLVVVPSMTLGELAEWAVIEPLPGRGEQDESEQRDIFPAQRLHETVWAKRQYAVPFGSPQFVLYYRKDLWDGQGWEAPVAWKGYQQQIEQLAKELKRRGGAPAYAVAEPLGEGWAAPTLLSRAAPYVRHASQFSDLFDYATMKPLIDQPPFVRALEELVRAARLAPPDVMQSDPEQLKRWFYSGRVAMVMAWPSSAFAVRKEVEQPIEPAQVALAPLPGSEEAYHFEWKAWDKQPGGVRRVPLLGASGRLGAIVRGTKQRSAAADALLWLSSRKWSSAIASSSRATTCFRSSHVGDVRWVDEGLSQDHAQAYGEIVEETQSLPRSMFALRIPGGRAYMKVLDEAVRKAVRDEIDVAGALREVAAEWEKLTDALGRELQQRAYRRSLGLP